MPAFRADRLNEEIAKRVLGNEDAARLIGCPERSLRRWRNGTDPRQKNVRAIARAFDKDPAYFIEQDPPAEDVAA